MNRMLILVLLAKSALAANFFCCGSSSLKSVHDPAKAPITLTADDAKESLVIATESEAKWTPGEEGKLDSSDVPSRITLNFDSNEVLSSSGVEIIIGDQVMSDNGSQSGIEIPDVDRLRAHIESGSAHSSESVIFYSLGDICPIISVKPHDFSVQVKMTDNICSQELVKLAEFNRYICMMPFEEAYFFQSNLLLAFESLYPGLRQVPITEKDVICLLIFAFLRDGSSERVADELETLHLHFDSEILEEIGQVLRESGNSDAAFQRLFKRALEMDCYYTVEAFMAANVVVPFADEAEAMSWIVHFSEKGSSSLIEKYLTPELKIKLEQFYNVNSILPLLLEKGCRSETILLLSLWRDDEIEAAAFNCLESGNWFMFMKFMALEQQAYSFLRPEVLECARIIYFKEDVELFKAKFDKMTSDYAAVMQLILKLGSPEPAPLLAFKHIIVSQKVNSEGMRLAEQLALFSDELNYLRAIITISPGSFECIRKSPDWHVIRGAKNYDEIMKIMALSNEYQIFHSLANPYLSEAHWESLLLPSKTHPTQIQCTFDDLIEKLGFNNEILTCEDIYDLQLTGKRAWSLLQLAVVSLNVNAVKALISHPLLDIKDDGSNLNLSKRIRAILQNNTYFCNHPFIQAQNCSLLRVYMYDAHPKYYKDPVKLEGMQDFQREALDRCDQIIELLEAQCK